MSLTDHDDNDGSDDGDDDRGEVRMIRFLDLRREIHVIVDGLKEKALDEAFLRPTKVRSLILSFPTAVPQHKRISSFTIHCLVEPLELAYNTES